MFVNLRNKIEIYIISITSLYMTSYLKCAIQIVFCLFIIIKAIVALIQKIICLSHYYKTSMKVFSRSIIFLFLIFFFRKFQFLRMFWQFKHLMLHLHQFK